MLLFHEVCHSSKIYLLIELEYSMIFKLLTEHHLKFLSLKGGCRGSSESTHVKMPHCWKSHVLTVSDHLTKMAALSIYGRTNV